MTFHSIVSKPQVIFIQYKFRCGLFNAFVLFSAVKKFGIKIFDGSKYTFKLTDDKETPIPTNDDFIGIVKTFHSSSTLVIDYESTALKRNPKLVTPLVIFKFICSNF